MANSDYPIGYTATITVDQQSQTLSAIGAVGPKLSEIATEAAKAAGMDIKGVAIEAGLDVSDEPAYFFNYEIPPGGEVSGNMRSRLLGELRDRLLAGGATNYPYVRLIAA